jgi:hypothetical protein
MTAQVLAGSPTLSALVIRLKLYFVFGPLPVQAVWLRLFARIAVKFGYPSAHLLHAGWRLCSGAF